MAYTKLQKCRSDYVLGYQTVNTAKDNQDAHRDSWTNQHGAEEFPPSRSGIANPAALLGHHSNPRIPRDVLRVTCSVSTSFGAPEFGVSESWFVSGAQRISAGQYFFPVRTLTDFWGTATPSGGSSTTRWARCLTYYRQPLNSLPSGIFVFCNTISGGSFTAFDMNFSLVIYGYAPG